MDTAELVLLVLSFPAMGLLLFALAAMEKWLGGPLDADAPGQADRWDTPQAARPASQTPVLVPHRPAERHEGATAHKGEEARLTSRPPGSPPGRLTTNCRQPTSADKCPAGQTHPDQAPPTLIGLLLLPQDTCSERPRRGAGPGTQVPRTGAIQSQWHPPPSTGSGPVLQITPALRR